MNLAGLFVRERDLFMFPQNKGRFYHDGRFQTLLGVVNSYDARFNLGLTEEEKHDLVEYLKWFEILHPIVNELRLSPKNSVDENCVSANGKNFDSVSGQDACRKMR